MWRGVARCSGGAVGRCRLLVPVLVVGEELGLCEEAAVEQQGDGLAVHVDADEDELLPAVTHLVVREVLEDLRHLRGSMKSELRERRRTLRCGVTGNAPPFRR